MLMSSSCRRLRRCSFSRKRDCSKQGRSCFPMSHEIGRNLLLKAMAEREGAGMGKVT